ncbi:MAG: hypothetical protein RQ826_13695, partial [Xanthomonadales bacterium]|nr:hypothetical protein [Xanthomonadales bacterium]
RKSSQLCAAEFAKNHSNMMQITLMAHFPGFHSPNRQFMACRLHYQWQRGGACSVPGFAEFTLGNSRRSRK